jgi:hypothetical protein
MSGCHIDDAALASADGVGGCEPPVGRDSPPSENLRCWAECTSLSHDARRIGRWAGMLLTECSDMVIGALVSWSSSEDTTASESGVERRPGPRALPSMGAILPITWPGMIDVVAADMAADMTTVGVSSCLILINTYSEPGELIQLQMQTSC